MIKVRAQQVTIETPREGAEPWIRVVVQRVEKDGEIVNTVDRWDSFNKRLSLVAMEQHPMPVLINKVGTVYDVSVAISSVVIGWLIEKYGGTVTETGDVIIEE